MGRYLAKRLVQAIPLLIGISVICFVVMHLAPGGPMAAYLVNPKVSRADIMRLERLYGLDKPVYVQYFKWLVAVIRGNLGYSFRNGLPVARAIAERLPATILLMTSSFLLAVVVAIPIGVFSALRRYSSFDYAVTAFAFLGIAIPSFWFGMMMQLIFTVWLRVLPSSGMATIGAPFSVADRLRYLLMPMVVLGLMNMATWSRFMRSSMLETIYQDYIRTARSKGLTPRIVIGKHALKNALIPVATMMGLNLPNFFGGAIITERLFAWPGIGRLYFDAVLNRDYPILMGVLLMAALLVVAGNLAADLTYGLLDPRIKYE